VGPVVRGTRWVSEPNDLMFQDKLDSIFLLFFFNFIFFSVLFLMLALTLQKNTGLKKNNKTLTMIASVEGKNTGGRNLFFPEYPFEVCTLCMDYLFEKPN
jgi:hypothetical protein